MVPPKAEPSERESHQRAKDNVEAVMSEVRVTGGRDVNGGSDRNERND